jgi:RHS repeat-associated protein
MAATDEYAVRIGAEIDIYKHATGSPSYYSTNVPGSLLIANPNGADIQVYQTDARVFKFVFSMNAFVLSEIYDRISNQALYFEFCTDLTDSTCARDAIKAIRSSTGRTLEFVYGDAVGPAGQISANRLLRYVSAGATLATFNYDDAGRLLAASYPAQAGTVTRVYGYNEPGRVCVSATGASISPCYVGAADTLLTSISDENGAGFAVFKYDNLGRVVSSEHAGGVDRFALTYNSDTVTTVADPDGGSTSYTSTLGRFYQLTGLSKAGHTTTHTYDVNGFLDLSTDRAGIITDHDFDATGRLTKVTRAKSTPQVQVENIGWDSTSNQPNLITRTGQRIERTFNARGQRLTVTVIDTTVTPNQSRTTTYRYCEQADIDLGACPLLGQLLSVDGPRADVSDVTTFAYYMEDHASCASAPSTCAYRRGDLWKRTDALGHASEFRSYDTAGRATSLRDSNNVITDLEFSPRGWLTATKVRGADDLTETDDVITRIEYDAVGQLNKISLPDGTLTRFTYDNAHRLTDITDKAGNSVHYTLNNAGNPTNEQFKSPDGSVTRSQSSVYNALGQLLTLKDAYNRSTGFVYDAMGRTDTATDPLSRVLDRNYDPIGRLSQIIQNKNKKGTDQATTSFSYDTRDNLVSITDPKGLVTTYVYNGFDELKQLASPDSGVTVLTYDQAGNPTSKLDARGISTVSTFDALNRLTSLTVPTSTQAIGYTFDSLPSECGPDETFSVGRLSQMTDESGVTRYCYDRRGNLLRKVQSVIGGTTLVVSPTYNAANQISALSYPSGAIAVFSRDDAGQIRRIDVVPVDPGPQLVAIDFATHLPFGPLASMQLGARTLNRTFDLDYAPDRVFDANTTGIDLDIAVDAMSNVVGLTERTSPSATLARTYTVDGLNRLTAQKNGSSILEQFTYDATGNRISRKVGATTTPYAYPSGSHKLSSVGGTTRGYDASGNTTSIGTQTFVFDDLGRMHDYKVGTSLIATYRVNARGERVLKTNVVSPSSSEQFIYDEAGHLLGEYTHLGARIREYVWLDDTLVAVLGNFGGSTYQLVETDHVGTPRAVINPATNAVVWRWDLNPSGFGDHFPNGDPDGDGVQYTQNIRFPGQYYDSESGMDYNYFRDYEPSTGRYLESDPIGLKGGLNTYRYVYANPLIYSDPEGLQCRPYISFGGGRETRMTNRELVNDAGWSFMRASVDPIAPGKPMMGRAHPSQAGGLGQAVFGSETGDCWAKHTRTYRESYETNQLTYSIELCVENDCDNKGVFLRTVTDRKKIAEFSKLNYDTDFAHTRAAGTVLLFRCLEWLKTLH